MEDEDAELEEGEAKEALDPDTDFSYIDTRLQNVLGDCQKEFQGGNLSTEKLGSKYGGYGTFLPTHARAPSLLADPHPAPPALELGRPAGDGVVEPVKRSAGTPVQQVNMKENGAGSAFAATTVKKIKIKLGKGDVETEEAKRKALYNGLGLDDESDDASLDDDDNYSRSNVESPEPSPMSMIEIMTAPCPEGGLLSPLSDSTFETFDPKEANSYMYKPGVFSTGTSNAHSTASKGGMESPRDPGLGYRKGKGCDTDKNVTEEKRVVDLVADSNGRRKSRRDSDAGKPIAKEGQRPSKSGRNENSKKEQQELLDEKGMEGLVLEDPDSGRDPLSRSSRKQLEPSKPLVLNGQKEKEVMEGKGAGKSQAPRNRDSKEFSWSKSFGKVNVHKDSEAVRLTDIEKESYDKGFSLTEAKRLGKEDSKDPVPAKVKENFREGLKDNQRKESLGDIKPKDPIKDSAKSGSNPGSTKKPSSTITGRKGVSSEHKGSKLAQDKKATLKEIEKERSNLSEHVAVAGREDEKIAAVAEPVSATLAALVVPQVVLDNWVACDKCGKWRLLMPHVKPESLPKKWRCKMMDWLPNMNNCKFEENETTDAVYAYLGYQKPVLPAAGLDATDPAALPPPIPVVEPPVEKWPEETDTKKRFLPKKGQVRKSGGGGAKGAASKGADGAVKSKNLNDVAGLDSSGDGRAHVSDKEKHKARESVKRARPSEGDDTRIKKKVLQEQERNVEVSHWSKEPMDLEPVQGDKEKVGFNAPGESQVSVLAKRKKMGTVEDLDEAPSLKKNKGGRAKSHFDDLQVPSEEEYLEIDKRLNVQKSRREASTQKTTDIPHTALQDKETQDIDSVLKDLRDEDIGVHKHREESESAKVFAEGQKFKANFVEKQRRSKEDGSDTELRNRKKRKESASPYDRHNRASPLEKPKYGREDLNRSTSSKVSNSSSKSSDPGMKAVGSPLESTVSSSPTRGLNGSRELLNSRVAPGHTTVGTDIAVPSSPGPKHVREASRGSSWDEGEFRHVGVTHNVTRFGKHESGVEVRDEGWYDEEVRGVDRIHNHNYNVERHAHITGDIDDVGEHQRRRGNRERDSDRVRIGVKDSDHVDQDDDYAKERSLRDDRGRLSRDSGLDKPGGRPWEELKPDAPKYVHKRDDVPLQGFGTRVVVFNRDTNREGDGIATSVRKDGSGSAAGPADFTKRPGRSLITRSGGDRGETLRREDLESGLGKASVGEAAASSPAKKEKENAQAILLSNNYLKNAKDLKHSADRLKSVPEQEMESFNLYMQSALKFLQSAAILEPVQAESARHGELTRSMTLYNDTAGLCEFCASLCKRRGDLRATALAYTCAAVARTRLMMSKQACFSRDCSEIQCAAQLTAGPHMPNNGESPSSSSASDVDNLNKQHALVPGGKVAIGKPAIASPQVLSGATSGTSLNIPARLRPVAARFLHDANDMSALLDSWRKAADATAKAEASKETEGMAAVKQVGELGGFGDIDGVVRLVRLALEAIGH